jgi:hypothetical protein
MLTDKDIPLSTLITSTNTHDLTVAIHTVDSMVIKDHHQQQTEIIKETESVS